MPRPPSESQFRAPIVHMIPAEAGSSEGYEGELLGFVVTSQLDQHPESRGWWAERLGVSRSNMVKMAQHPTLSFVDKLDVAMADEASDEIQPAPVALRDEVTGTSDGGMNEGAHGRPDPLPQRLTPQLTELYRAVMPGEGPENGHILEWLARDPSILDDRRVSADVLLYSEVAVQRCHHLALSGSIEHDEVVRKSIDELMRVASGPYGGSAVAHERLTELALLVPETFFDLLEDHLNKSPVGFRLLRTLDRFVNTWRGRERMAAPQRIDRRSVDVRLARLLGDLGKASMEDPYLDPYPGREWSITLARDCLATGRERELVRTWLRNTYLRDDASERERLYAGWAIVAFDRTGDRRDVDEVVEVFSAADGRLLNGWARLFRNHLELRQMDRDELRATIEEEFREEHMLVADAVERHAADEQFRGIRTSLQGLVFAALVTPDGKLRRNLIEAVVAAHLVRPTNAALLDVFDSSPPGLRESIIFFLSRLRQPTETVADRLLDASLDQRHPSIVHAALWGMGDITPRGGGDQADRLLPRLTEVVLDREGSTASHRISAAHALAIMAKATQSTTSAGMGGLPPVGEGDKVDDIVAGLLTWGKLMAAGPGEPDVGNDTASPDGERAADRRRPTGPGAPIDPTALGVDRLLLDVD